MSILKELWTSQIIISLELYSLLFSPKIVFAWGIRTTTFSLYTENRDAYYDTLNFIMVTYLLTRP